MPVKLKKMQLAEDFGTAQGKWFARTVQYPIVETPDLAQQVAFVTGFTPTMVETVLEKCLDAMSVYLSIGHPVRLGKIGVVRVNARSEATTNKEDVKVTLVPGLKASTTLRSLVGKFPYTYVNEKGDTATDDTGDDEVITTPNDNDNENPDTPTPPAGGSTPSTPNEDGGLDG